MGKSKYSLKAQEKIHTGANPRTKSRHVYYDEKIAQKGSGMSKNVFVLLIGLMVIGAGTGVYFLLTGDSNNTVIGGNNTSTIPEGGLQEGDRFMAHYKLWKADISGPDGVIDTSGPTYDNSTKINDDPIEFSTDRVIVGFKNNILGMKEGEEKTFTLESGEGYTSDTLAYYRLTFWVQIVEIL